MGFNRLLRKVERRSTNSSRRKPLAGACAAVAPDPRRGPDGFGPPGASADAYPVCTSRCIHCAHRHGPAQTTRGRSGGAPLASRRFGVAPNAIHGGDGGDQAARMAQPVRALPHRGLPSTGALVACARKLARIAWHMFKHPDADYDPAKVAGPIAA